MPAYWIFCCRIWNNRKNKNTLLKHREIVCYHTGRMPGSAAIKTVKQGAPAAKGEYRLL